MLAFMYSNLLGFFCTFSAHVSTGKWVFVCKSRYVCVCVVRVYACVFCPLKAYLYPRCDVYSNLFSLLKGPENSLQFPLFGISFLIFKLLFL